MYLTVSSPVSQAGIGPSAGCEWALEGERGAGGHESGLRPHQLSSLGRAAPLGPPFSNWQSWDVRALTWWRHCKD